MDGGNASDWIRAAEKHGKDLSWLYQDKEKAREDLAQLGIPQTEFYVFEGEQLNLPELVALFNGSDYFCRLFPKEAEMERPYRLHISSHEQLKEFCSQHDLSKYRIHLAKREGIVYIGSITAKDDGVGEPGKCIVELIKGDGPDLFHGEKTPFSAELSPTRAIQYRGTQIPSEAERRIISRALNIVGGLSHPFPGYYEFGVLQNGGILFFNYQSPESAYAKI